MTTSSICIPSTPTARMQLARWREQPSGPARPIRRPPPPLSTIQFLSAKPLQDGRTLSLVRPFQGTGEGGDLVLIDTDTYVDNTRARLGRQHSA